MPTRRDFLVSSGLMPELSAIPGRAAGPRYSLLIKGGRVLACATANAAETIPGLKGLGTLKTGAAADITVLELKEGEFEFVGNIGGKRTGRQKLFARAVDFGGKVWEGEMAPPPPAEPRA
jgi:cytosine/adenosine deaminase-related metal-dependent hydrolase